MDDCISREAAIAEIMGQPPDAHYPSWYAEQIKKLPAAEVKPVVRGKWKLLEGGVGRCSNCKSVLKDVWDYDGSDPFCSECGADMREVSTSEEPLNSEGTTRKEQEHNG
jgi:hypothetical protein